ncbi:MAG: hypothetical protein ACRCT1_22440 [Microcoleaceae cyanobacterium]
MTIFRKKGRVGISVLLSKDWQAELVGGKETGSVIFSLYPERDKLKYVQVIAIAPYQLCLYPPRCLM